jgi:molybdopterin molybdotransferase
VPSINVPAHDNSAMDGYALRFSDLQPGDTALAEVGAAFAGGSSKARSARANACAS